MSLCYCKVLHDFMLIKVRSSLNDTERFTFLDSGFVKTCQKHVICLEYSYGRDSKYIQSLETPASRVSRHFGHTLYAAVTSVASKIITFYPEVVGQIFLDPLWGD